MEMLMQAKVSMVVPCYNKAPHIGNMLQSVYSQKWNNIELIFVNDGSTDGTREIIGKWKAMFIQRGYEVIVIDQENQGVAAAIKNGMKHVSGEYVCWPDCDDMLEREYVSCMAGWLEEHSEYDWASCDAIWIQSESTKYIRSIGTETILSKDSGHKYFFFEIKSAVFLYMVREKYIMQCRLMESFCTEPAITQEPQILLPLAMGEGKIKHIKKTLYTYNGNTSGIMNSLQTFDDRIRFRQNYIRMIQSVASRMNIEHRDKASISLLANKFWIMLNWGDEIRPHEYYLKLRKECVAQINAAFRPTPILQEKQITETNFRYLFKAVDAFLCKRTNVLQIKSGRVIGYGALGEMAKINIEGLLNTALEPQVLWDVAANSGNSLAGIPVSKPNFSILTSGDTLLVFPKGMEMVKKQCENINGIRILSYYEIEDFCALSYFPIFTEEIEFVG
jgi:glycosyltransferase involved in cell wall biosynthesis